jgi:glucose/arabinose dehydrogenase
MRRTLLTRPRPRARVAGCALLAVTAVLGACGDDGDEARGATTTAATAGAADATTGSTGPTGSAPVELALVDTGLELDEPIALMPAPDGDALLIAERGGRVLAARPEGDRLVLDDDEVIDLRERVGSTDGERGLLGIAVGPDGEHLYVSYTAAADGASQVDELTMSEQSGRWRADPASRRNLLDVEQPFANHNGGHVEFGPDDLLYVGLGDGGSGGDPEGRAQDPDTLLGKMLRLDPSAEPPVPADNPFVGDDELGARDEIWATGLRNPWRFSFDRVTGDLWIADVGQDTTEEVNVLRAADGGGRGANLGWDLFEGDQRFDDADPAGAASEGPFVEPVHTYGRDQGCSVTGGVVYRGAAIPSLVGTYVFADLCGDELWGLPSDDPSGAAASIVSAPAQVVGFGQDRAGELYVISLSEGVFQLSTG